MLKLLSEKKRWEIAILEVHRLGLKLSFSTLSKKLHYSLYAIKHWLQVYRETGDIQEKPKSSWLKITGSEENTMITDAALNNRQASSWTLTHTLSSQGLTLSTATVKRCLANSGVHWLPSLKKPLLKNSHKKIHLA